MINCTENKRHEPNVRYLNDLMLNNKLTGNLADLKDADESGALRMTTLLFYFIYQHLSNVIVMFTLFKMRSC